MAGCKYELFPATIPGDRPVALIVDISQPVSQVIPGTDWGEF